jgi:hypothetical protein
MALTNDAKGVMLNALGAVALRASLHTADPGSSGTNEVTGGSYARQPIDWNAAASGALDNNTNPAFAVPSATTVTHFGIWNTAGTVFYGGGSLSGGGETFTNAGTYTLTDADITLT